jgi:4-amino-4-deoxy-L-arabinose transferase-like glycosyltransferase
VHVLTILGIGALGLALRCYYTASVSSKQHFGGDAYFFYYWPGVQLARGHGYLDYQSLLYGYPIPGAEHPPGFVAVIALLYKLGFHSPTEMRYAMCLLGSATIVVLGLLVSRLISKRAGIVAALLTAFYPNVWINDTLLMSETLTLFGVALALLGVYGFFQRPTWKHVLVASAGLTVAASARPENLALFALVILPLILARRSIDVRGRLRLVAVAALLPLLVFVPWTVYNNARFSRPVTLSTGFGQTVQVATCDTTFSGPNIGNWSLTCARTYKTGLGSPTAPSVPPKQLQAYLKVVRAAGTYAQAHGDLPPAHLDRKLPPQGHYKDQSVDNDIFLRQSLRYLWDHKTEVPKVVFVREARTLELWNPSQTNSLNVFAQRGSIRLVSSSQWMFWALCLLSLAGAATFRRKKIILYPLTMQMLLVAAVVGVTFGSTRYRAPLELCLVILSAAAIDTFLAWGRRRTGASTPPGARVDGAFRHDLRPHDPEPHEVSNDVHEMRNA